MQKDRVCTALPCSALCQLTGLLFLLPNTPDPSPVRVCCDLLIAIAPIEIRLTDAERPLPARKQESIYLAKAACSCRRYACDPILSSTFSPLLSRPLPHPPPSPSTCTGHAPLQRHSSGRTTRLSSAGLACRITAPVICTSSARCWIGGGPCSPTLAPFQAKQAATPVETGPSYGPPPSFGKHRIEERENQPAAIAKTRKSHSSAVISVTLLLALSQCS